MLRFTRPALLALAISCALAEPAIAQQTTAGQSRDPQTAALPEQPASIGLRRPAIVVGDVVTLGDLFTGLPTDQAGTPIARSPKLGESVPVDAAWLGRLARHYDVAWAPRSHLDGTVVKHDAIVIDAAQVQAEVTKLLEAQEGGARLDVAIDASGLAIPLPVESEGRFGLEGLRREARSGRFTVDLVYPATGAPAIRVPVSGRAVELVEVPVLSRRVRDNEVIGRNDIGWEMRRADRIAANMITDSAQLIGMSPRRNLRAGQPIRSGDLRAPVLVARNSLVTMRLQSANMVLTAQGRTLDDGSHGSVVRVINLKSNTIVQAVVADAGVVEVMAGGQAFSH